MIKPFIIQCKTAEVSAAIQQLLFSFGYQWPTGKGLSDLANVRIGNFSNPSGTVGNAGHTIWHGYMDWEQYDVARFEAETDFAALVKFLSQKPPTRLEISYKDKAGNLGGYIVLIHDNKTEVGCQTFLNSDILQIAELIEERSK